MRPGRLRVRRRSPHVSAPMRPTKSFPARASRHASPSQFWRATYPVIFPSPGARPHYTCRPGRPPRGKQPDSGNNWVRPPAGARRPPWTRRRAPARATRVLHRAPRRHVTGWQRGTAACAGTRVLALFSCARFLARTLFGKIISHT